jgi:BirA family biotin operon repressor/biotin-[acetyl-CoA-carboxylase] ligase
LGQILALSVASTLLKYGLKPQIKWPNDLLIDDKKICGILCEITFEKALAHVFLGLGLNVDMEQKNLLLIDQKATSIKEETKKSWDPKKVLEEIENTFLKDLAIFLKSGFSAFHEKFEKMLAYKGKIISLYDGENQYIGTIDSVNLQGQLIFKLSSGEKKVFSSGDITL